MRDKEYLRAFYYQKGMDLYEKTDESSRIEALKAFITAVYHGNAKAAVKIALMYDKAIVPGFDEESAIPYLALWVGVAFELGYYCISMDLEEMLEEEVSPSHKTLVEALQPDSAMYGYTITTIDSHIVTVVEHAHAIAQAVLTGGTFSTLLSPQELSIVGNSISNDESAQTEQASAGPSSEASSENTPLHHSENDTTDAAPAGHTPAAMALAGLPAFDGAAAGGDCG